MPRCAKVMPKNSLASRTPSLLPISPSLPHPTSQHIAFFPHRLWTIAQPPYTHRASALRERYVYTPPLPSRRPTRRRWTPFPLRPAKACGFLAVVTGLTFSPTRRLPPTPHLPSSPTRPIFSLCAALQKAIDRPMRESPTSLRFVRVCVRSGHGWLPSSFLGPSESYCLPAPSNAPRSPISPAGCCRRLLASRGAHTVPFRCARATRFLRALTFSCFHFPAIHCR